MALQLSNRGDPVIQSHVQDRQSACTKEWGKSAYEVGALRRPGTHRWKRQRPSLSFLGRAVLIRECLSRVVALVAATGSKIAEASSQAGTLPTVYTWTSPRHDYL
ncbi:uncharacterized protein LOC143149367 [Ptiloglossa arizonensis]|uniref:uncharacterized protein LOC143149367 n=1 Tax=Ptiloglossa arizonensis TaxID=3350558 RepID=UPI003F9EFF25